MNYENFTFMGNWREMYETLPDDKMRLNFIEAVIKYGTTYEVPNSENDPLTYALMLPIMSSIDKAKDNYANGSKGGRPKQYNQKEFNDLFELGLTNKQVEEKTGASHATVERKKKIWRDSKPIQENDYEQDKEEDQEKEQEEEDEERGYEVLRSPQNTHDNNPLSLGSLDFGGNN